MTISVSASSSVNTKGSDHCESLPVPQPAAPRRAPINNCVGTLEHSTTSPTAMSRRWSGVKRSMWGGGNGSTGASGSVRGGEDGCIAVLDRVKTTEYYRTSWPCICSSDARHYRVPRLDRAGLDVFEPLFQSMRLRNAHRG